MLGIDDGGVESDKKNAKDTVQALNIIVVIGVNAMLTNAFHQKDKASTVPLGKLFNKQLCAKNINKYL